MIASMMQQGNNYLRNQDLRKAENLYRKILNVDIKNAEALHNLGLVLYQSGKMEEAITLLEQSILYDSNKSQYYNNLAVIFLNLGENLKAEKNALKAVSFDPKNHEYLTTYGATQQSLSNLIKAEEVYKTALSLKPDYLPAMTNQGLTALELEKFTESENLFRNALKIQSDSIESTIGLARTLLRTNRLEEAENILQVVKKKFINIATFSTTLADVLINKKEYKSALDTLEESEKNNPCNKIILNCKGYIFREMCREDEAIKIFQKVLKIDPGNTEANVNIGMIYLSRKLFKQGWKHYKYRKNQKKVLQKKPNIIAEQWTGQKLKEKHLTVWTEQGIGDEILQTSLIPDLVKISKKLSLICSERLFKTFKRSFPSVEIIKTESYKINRTSIKSDYASPLLDTAIHLRESEKQFPVENNYIKPNKDIVTKLRNKYELTLSNNSNKCLIIGLSWESKNISYGVNNTIPLIEWGPIFSVLKRERNSTAIVATQYNIKNDEIENISKKFSTKIIVDKDVNYSGCLESPFAQIAACDLIITTSTTTAQIAGSLGKDVWHLPSNGISCGWYWTSKGKTTPWYPKMLHFRKKASDNSEKQISNVAKKLEETLISRESDKLF